MYPYLMGGETEKIVLYHFFYHIIYFLKKRLKLQYLILAFKVHKLSYFLFQNVMFSHSKVLTKL